MRPSSFEKYQVSICDPIPISFTKSLARTEAGRIMKHRGTKRVFIEHLCTGGYQYASQIMDPNDHLVPVKGPEGRVQVLTDGTTILKTDPRQQMEITLPWPRVANARPSRHSQYCTTAHSITQGQISLAWKGAHTTAQHLDITNIYMPPDIITLDYDGMAHGPLEQSIFDDFDPTTTHDVLFHIICIRNKGFPKRYFAIVELLRRPRGPEKKIYCANVMDETDDTVQRLMSWYDRYMDTRDRAPDADRHRTWVDTIYGNSKATTYATRHKVAYCFKIASLLFCKKGSLMVKDEAGNPGDLPNQDIRFGASGSDTALINSFLAINSLY
ncbi:hypothetical protein FVEG_09771 [Fusarium verticillioides 7600]|uniref:Uncharacterized protein n=1 Tax=Gibberella moniliformis (strain M3125 / FGSC 7600) TaxID=334819 RepID=W7MG07_GIBM7|nr:hypothetical protein FVEG_09771 [Fusarium verticillioides 7600]EWG50603.1 hypothetical protein FVEG_09771 [Fusarium verticillioides 7600]